MIRKLRANASQIFKWLALGCFGLFLLGPCAFGLAFKTWEANWNSQLATLIATDDRIAAFGDGSQAVPFTPEAAIAVGQSAIVDELRVLVTISERVEDITNLGIMPENAYYWAIEFSVENISAQEKYPHPIVDSQMQYIVNGRYIWERQHFADCLPSVENGVPSLAPRAKFSCKLIYSVPDDDQPIYWVYKSAGYEEYVVLESVKITSLTL